MTVFWIIIAVVAVIILIFSQIPVLAGFKIDINNSDICGKIYIKYWFINIEIDIKEYLQKKNKKNKDNKRTSLDLDKLKNMLINTKNALSASWEDIKDALLYFKRYVFTINELSFKLKFDFENPMETGIATGTLNGAVYSFIGLLDNIFGVKKMNVDITPLFENKNYAEGEISGILKIKKVHIIVIKFKYDIIASKIKKIMSLNV